MKEYRGKYPDAVLVCRHVAILIGVGNSHPRKRKRLKTIECLECGRLFQGYATRKFCSQSCSASYNNKKGKIGFNKDREKYLNTYACHLSRHEQYLHKYGVEEGERKWEVFKRRCRENTPRDANALFRYIMIDGIEEGVDRYGMYLARVMDWNHKQHTLSPEELYGKERAEQMRKIVSDRFKQQIGPKNPQYGKPPVWPKGYYVKELGHKVRSTFEEDMGKLLVKKKISYQYESHIFKVRMGDKIYHYTPDFQLSTTVFIETKGFLFYPNYEKMLNFIKQYPGVTLIVVYLTWQEEMYKELGKFNNFRAFSWDGLNEKEIVKEINDAVNS